MPTPGAGKTKSNTSISGAPGFCDPSSRHEELNLQAIAIIGVGLIGGSLGQAFRRRGWRVIGIDRSSEVLQKAIERKAIDEAASDISAIRNGELVVLATPLESIAEVFTSAQPHLRDNAVVTDVGSVKVPIVRQIEKVRGTAGYVGGHPMFGTAEQGIDAASAELVEGAPFILTPTERTPPEAVRRVTSALQSVGLSVIVMSPAEHDRAIAVISHLPYLIGVALTRIGDKSEAAGPSFKGVTRVAGSPVELWRSILDLNRSEVLRAVDLFTEELKRISGLEGEELERALEQARQRQREPSPSKPKASLRKGS